PRVEPWPALPLSFEPNVGQAAPNARFVVHVGRSVALLSARELVTPPARLELVGAAEVLGRARGPLPGRVSYFTGNDPAAWHTAVPTFARVEFAGVWPGIDVVY